MESKKWTKIRANCPVRREEEYESGSGKFYKNFFCGVRNRESFELCHYQRNCPFVYFIEGIGKG